MMRFLIIDERGTETVEWALIVGLVVGGLVLTLTAIGLWVDARFDALQTEIGA